MANFSDRVNIDKRESRYISKKFGIPEGDTDNINVIYSEIIPMSISYDEKDKPKDIENYLKQNLLALSQFTWIDEKNKRLCDYIWSLLRICTSKNISLTFPINILANEDKIFTNKNPQGLGYEILYEKLGLEILPKDRKIKKDYIILFFDLLDFDINTKVELLNRIKSKWTLASQKNDVSNWVNDSNKHWAWSYLCQDVPPVWYINSNSQDDLLLGVITLFDLLNDYPDKRELTLSKMRSAWSQKSYRDKNNGKKSVNIVLSEETIKKLGIICENTDRRKNEVVTRLIKEEFEKMQKSGR